MSTSREAREAKMTCSQTTQLESRRGPQGAGPAAIPRTIPYSSTVTSGRGGGWKPERLATRSWNTYVSTWATA